MLEISIETRQKYLIDGTDKQFIIEIDGVEYTNTNLLNGSTKLIESLNSKDTLSFASVEASTISFTFINIDKEISDLQDKIAIVTQIVNDEPIPYGTFKLTQVTRDVDLLNCTGTDNIYKFDIDVANFWNSLTFPIMHKNLLIALCNYVGVEYNLPSTYTNFNIEITKAIEISELSGKDLLGYLADITGSFLSIDRYGKLKIYQLSSTSLYPSETLYPNTIIYPAQGVAHHYYPSTFADTRIEVGDYSSKKIDKVIIRSNSNDIGTIVGFGTNAYIVESNFLLYGFETADLINIANNILNTIKDIQITSIDGSFVGLPHIEKGDYIEVTNQQNVISRTFLLKRTLSGIQSLIDDFDIQCAYERTQNTSVNKSIKILKQKTNELYRSIDTLSSTITDVEQGLQSQITQNAGNITLKVSKDEVISQINLSSEVITISASKLNLSGYATFTSLSTAGQTTINAGNVSTGTISADRIASRSITASKIALGTLTADQIASNTITAAEIATGAITADKIYAKTLSGINFLVGNDSAYGNITFSEGGKLYNYPGGGIGVAAIMNTSTILPITDNSRNLGSSSRRWDNIYATNTTIQSSDRKLKKNIKSIQNGIELIYSLNPVQFRWKKKKRIHYGFIAQDFKEAMTAVGIADCAAYIDGSISNEADVKGLRYGEIIAPLVQTVQDQHKIIENLLLRVSTLEGESNA